MPPKFSNTAFSQSPSDLALFPSRLPHNDGRYREVASARRGKGDDFVDPWMRAKSPKSRRRRSYSSGSSGRSLCVIAALSCGFSYRVLFSALNACFVFSSNSFSVLFLACISGISFFHSRYFSHTRSISCTILSRSPVPFSTDTMSTSVMTLDPILS